MRLGDAHRKGAETCAFIRGELTRRCRQIVHSVRPVDLSGDGLDLLWQGCLTAVEHPKGTRLLGRVHDRLRQFDSTLPPVDEVGAHRRAHPDRGGDLPDGLVLGGEVLGKRVDGDHRGHAVHAHDLQMLEQVGPTEPYFSGVLLQHLGRQWAAGRHFVPPRVQLQRAHGRDDDRRVGHQA